MLLLSGRLLPCSSGKSDDAIGALSFPDVAARDSGFHTIAASSQPVNT